MIPSEPQEKPPAADDQRRISPDDPTGPPDDCSTPTASIGSDGDIRLSAVFDGEPNVQEADDPLLGTEIGGVLIVRVIGQGGMGKVYEGLQQKPKRTVAVKVMRPGLATPEMRKRFEFEAEILARLRHPGIAQIFSAGVESVLGVPVPYFVMEYIPGAKTLTSYAEELKLPTRARLNLFQSVCEAVAHGHQKGVVHRDLKPANILVDSTGQPKVIDFGVAKATDSDLALTTMHSDVGQLIGTLQYMGPEQIAGDPNEIDMRCDVYSLGVVIYELLTGKLPYDVRKKAMIEVLRIVKEEEPTPISAYDKTLRRDVAVIAGKCLEKDRGRRYSSASELGADVARHLAGEPIQASPPNFMNKLYRLTRRHGRTVLATVAAILRGAVLTMAASIMVLAVLVDNFDVVDAVRRFGWTTTTDDSPIYLADRLEKRTLLGWDGLRKGRLSDKAVNGTIHDKLLFAHAPSRVSYDLPSDFEGRLVGSVALAGLPNDMHVAVGRIDSRGSCRFRIFGDDQLLWESRDITQDKKTRKSLTQDFEVPLRAIKTVTLEVDSLGFHHDDASVWVDPKLIWAGYAANKPRNNGTGG